MWTERMEVKWGKAATVEAMTGEITPVTEFKDKTYKAFEKDIVPTEDGVYFIGFHAMSDPNKFYIYVDSVAVELNPELSAGSVVGRTAVIVLGHVFGSVNGELVA